MADALRYLETGAGLALDESINSQQELVATLNLKPADLDATTSLSTADLLLASMAGVARSITLAALGASLVAGGGVAAASHNHAGVYEPAIARGSTAQYFRGDLSLATLNQASVVGLTTSDNPVFAGLTLGADAGGDRTITLHSATTGKNMTVFTGSAAAQIKGTALPVVFTSTTSYVQQVSGAGQAQYFDAGGIYYWRDVDASNASRMTLDSSNGNLYVQGQVTIGDAQAGGILRLGQQDATGASRHIYMYCSASKFMDIYQSADTGCGIAGPAGGTMTISSGYSMNLWSASATSMSFSCGLLFQFQDRDASSVNRATIDSATGDFWTAGNHTLGADAGGARELRLYSGAAGKYARMLTDASGNTTFGAIGGSLEFLSDANGDMLFDAGGIIKFRDRDASYVDRVTIDTATGVLTATGDIITGVAKAYYIGPTGSDGSWRWVISGADLVIQKRVGGSWVTKSTISGA